MKIAKTRYLSLENLHSYKHIDKLSMHLFTPPQISVTTGQVKQMNIERTYELSMCIHALLKESKDKKVEQLFMKNAPYELPITPVIYGAETLEEYNSTTKVIENVAAAIFFPMEILHSKLTKSLLAYRGILLSQQNNSQIIQIGAERLWQLQFWPRFGAQCAGIYSKPATPNLLALGTPSAFSLPSNLFVNRFLSLNIERMSKVYIAPKDEIETELIVQSPLGLTLGLLVYCAQHNYLYSPYTTQNNTGEPICRIPQNALKAYAQSIGMSYNQSKTPLSPKRMQYAIHHTGLVPTQVNQMKRIRLGDKLPYIIEIPVAKIETLLGVSLGTFCGMALHHKYDLSKFISKLKINTQQLKQDAVTKA